MKLFRYTITACIAAAIAFSIAAQDNNTSSAGAVSRRTDRASRQSDQPAGISQRMQGFYDTADDGLSEGDVQYLRVIYRQIDLENDTNACLYFPEEPIEGQENLFRIIMRLLADNQLKAYEYLDITHSMVPQKFVCQCSDHIILSLHTGSNAQPTAESL